MISLHVTPTYIAVLLLRDSINYLLIYDPGTLLDGKPIINLPPKTINLSKVDFSVEERSFYTKLEADSRSQFKVLFPNYQFILCL